jgi:type VI secretion system protein ImpJ
MKTLSGIKLASPGKLDDVVSLSLPGVTFCAIASPPPFRHSFGSDVDFYKISNSGDDWKRAVDAGSLCYRWTGKQRNLRVALYWRDA